MASGATVGALRVVLGADIASFEDGLKGAEKSLARFNANMGKLGAAIGVSIAGAAVALGVAIKHTSEEIDKLGKTAQSIGVPIEELSKLKYAADLSGVSLEGLSTGVGKLAKNMSEFAGGGGDEAGKAFRALGLNVKDAAGNLRPVSDVIVDIAEKFGTMERGAGKTAIAMALFGRSGKDMIPLLNSGSAGLRDMYREAEELGLVISEKTFKAAEAFNDNLTRMSKIVEGLRIKVVGELAPGLVILTGALVDSGKQLSKQGQESSVVSKAMDELVRQVALGVVTFNSLGAALDKLLNPLENFRKKIAENAAGPNQVASAFDEMEKNGLKAAHNVALAAGLQLAAWKMLGQGALDLAGKTQPPILASDKFQKALDDLRIKAMEMQGAFAGLAPGFVQQAISLGIMDAATANAGLSVANLTDKQRQLNVAMMSVQAAQATKAFDDIRIKTMEMRGEFVHLAPGFVQQAISLNLLSAGHIKAGQAIVLTTAAQRQLNEQLMLFRAAQLTAEVATPWETYRQKIQEIDSQFQQGRISLETYQRQSQRVAEAAGLTWQQFGTNLAQTFVSLGEAFGKTSKEMFIVGKAGAIAQAVINTYQGATKALAELPPPLSYAAAAAVIASGLANVATIKAQQFTGAAQGGSFMVPGGMSGTDNRLIPMALASGERVDVTPANQAGKTVTIDVAGLGRDSYRRDEVIKILDGLNDLLDDNYKLRIN